MIKIFISIIFTILPIICLSFVVLFISLSLSILKNPDTSTPTVYEYDLRDVLSIKVNDYKSVYGIITNENLTDLLDITTNNFSNVSFYYKNKPIMITSICGVTFDNENLYKIEYKNYE